VQEASGEWSDAFFFVTNQRTDERMGGKLQGKGRRAATGNEIFMGEGL
jgi:hypothetical protein